jgi:1-acyl-sn-glycerol-3-phosphate acyltransferase
MGKLFTGIVKVTAYPIELVVFRTKIHYEDKSVQGRKIKGPAIIVSNHTSVYDFAQMMQVFFGRHLHCLMADILYRNRPMRWLLKELDGIKISREGKNFSFVEKSVDILKNGGVIEIYPEARIPEPNEVTPLEFKPSAAYIALLSRSPIIPIYTDGNYFGKGRAHIMIGKKIDVNELIDENLDTQENIKRINDYVRNKIVELRDETERKKEQRKKKKT